MRVPGTQEGTRGYHLPLNVHRAVVPVPRAVKPGSHSSVAVLP